MKTEILPRKASGTSPLHLAGLQELRQKQNENPLHPRARCRGTAAPCDGLMSSTIAAGSSRSARPSELPHMRAGGGDASAGLPAGPPQRWRGGAERRGRQVVRCAAGRGHLLGLRSPLALPWRRGGRDGAPQAAAARSWAGAHAATRTATSSRQSADTGGSAAGPREGAVAEPAPAATCGPSAPGRPRRQVRPYRGSPGRAHPRGGRASRLAGNAAPGPSALPWAEAWRHAGTPGGGLVPGPAPGTSSAKGYRVCSDRLDSLPFEALDLLSTSRATH